MASNHTPGPWVWNDRNQLVTVARTWVEYMGEEQQTLIVETDGGYYPPFAADKALIAAAPDLLEALKAVVRVAGRKTDEFDLAHAAIAKATGDAIAKATGDSDAQD